MKCPKCGSDNPPGTLFCEECDWRADQPVKSGLPRTHLTWIAVLLGAASLVLRYSGIPYGAVAAGAAGMVLGGYSMTLARITGRDDRTVLVAAAAGAICLSVVGFMAGLYGLV